jgi:DNA-binding SARP family transcriptional activator
MGDEPSASSHFDVLVLGPFALYRDGRPIDASAWQRKVQSLFRILVTSREYRRSREELVDMLWPESAPDAGGRNFRVVLHMLRRGLGGAEPSPVLSESGWVALNTAHEWDVDLTHFEELAAKAPEQIAALEEVAGYYRGEPLMEDRYDDWAVAVRARIQSSWRSVCLRLARLHRGAHAPEAAIGWLDRIVQSDPLDEEALRLLIAALGDLGRRAEAVRRFQQFAERLKDEMDLSPSQETLDVVAALRAREAQSAAPQAAGPETTTRPLPIVPRYPSPPVGRLVGREEELGRILWVLPPIHTVAPRLVMVEGEPGLGKTRLLAEVAERARQAGLLTLAGGSFQHEGRLMYGPIRDALSDYVEEEPEPLVRAQLGSVLGDLARLVPEARMRFPEIRDSVVGEGEDWRLRGFLAVTKALERIARDVPLVLLLDDLQWADGSTLQLLHFMVRRLSHNRLLVVGAYGVPRGAAEPEVVAVTADMEHGGWATRIVLGPLGEKDLATVLEEHIRGRCDPSLTAALHDRSEGNPLRALQMLRLLQQEGRLERSPTGWRLVEGAGALQSPLRQAGSS